MRFILKLGFGATSKFSNNGIFANCSLFAKKIERFLLVDLARTGIQNEFIYVDAPAE